MWRRICISCTLEFRLQFNTVWGKLRAALTLALSPCFWQSASFRISSLISLLIANKLICLLIRSGYRRLLFCSSQFRNCVRTFCSFFGHRPVLYSSLERCYCWRLEDPQRTRDFDSGKYSRYSFFLFSTCRIRAAPCHAFDHSFDFYIFLFSFLNWCSF